MDDAATLVGRCRARRYTMSFVRGLSEALPRKSAERGVYANPALLFVPVDDEQIIEMQKHETVSDTSVLPFLGPCAESVT